MKRTELILVIIWITFFLLKGIGYTGGAFFFGLATLTLSVYYIFWSLRVFQPDEFEPVTLSIIGGLSLASSLVTIPFTIYLRNQKWLEIAPLANLAFAGFLILLVGFKLLKKKKISGSQKRLLPRVLIVLAITSFFAFRPVSNSVYRNTIIFLNAGNDDLISNILAIEFVEKSDQEIELGNCDKAIEYALKAFHEGLNWLWIDENSLTQEDLKHLWKIQASYTNVFKAYECKAEQLNESGDYEQAIYFQLKADSFLNINPTAKNEAWRIERADSKNNLGIYYDRFGVFDSAVSFFGKAIIYHSDSIRKPTVKLSTYMNNLAKALADSRYWDESDQFAYQSIQILDIDTISIDKNENYSRSYLQLIYNSLQQYQLDKAYEYLTTIEPYLTLDQECKYNLYKSVLAFRTDDPRQTLSYAKKALECYHSHFDHGYQNIAETHKMLFNGWTQIPNYDSALYHIQEGLRITDNNYGNHSVRYHDYLKGISYCDYYTGNYEESMAKLKRIEEIYISTLGDRNEKLPEVLTLIGQIKIELRSSDDLDQLANRSLSLANEHEYFTDNRASDLLNGIAHLFYSSGNYSVADTLYSWTIATNVKAKRDSSLAIATALNGLGLIEMKNSRFDKADSLFNKSLDFYKMTISDLHPDIGIVLYNQAELHLKRNKLESANKLIRDAYENYSAFHRNDHPTLADLLILKGIIHRRMGNEETTLELWTQALDILKANFSADHRRINEVNELINRL